jgi:hypothetical protein
LMIFSGFMKDKVRERAKHLLPVNFLSAQYTHFHTAIRNHQP